MRIGLVCPYTLSRPGGVQAQVLGLARSLRRLDHDVRVLGPCDGAPPEPGIIALGSSVPIEANGSIAALAPDPAAQLRMLRALWDESFDVVNLHEPFAPGPTATALLIERAPIVGTFHAAGTSASYRYLAPVLRHFADRIDVRVAVSKDARALAAAALGGSYLTLFNGVEIDRHAAAEPWPTEAPTVLFLGRHEPRKGLGVLLEAFAGLDVDARLWVAGDGPGTAELRDRHDRDRRVVWLGRLTEAEKLRRLAGADVFCAPSLGGESFGVVLLEAMAAGTAVVASDLPGYRNAVRPDVDALLVSPGDVDALRRALSDVLVDGARRAGLVAAGRERAASMSMDRLADRYLEIFAGLRRPGGGARRRTRRSDGWFGRRRRIDP
ncbi:MAG: glycosyltransferase family 4 protein [Actinobacteria bacterium]|nr:glycosyltransferase family 4 protein [Actinomycetota bacterium]